MGFKAGQMMISLARRVKVDSRRRPPGCKRFAEGSGLDDQHCVDRLI